MDEFGKLLFEYLLIISAPGLAPHLDVLALVAVVAVLSVAVAVLLLHVIGVLRFGSTPSILGTRFEPGRMLGRALRGPARARAPSVVREFTRA